ncbi:hypothetical protein AcV5_002732 [Taiwanofungus camphoratus]|nr:hypothetical protein AcV5_002732 [Antrodia cinnamomea]
MTRVSVGGDTNLIAPFLRASLGAAAIAGEIWVASHEDMDIAGVVSWWGPGRTFLDSPDQAEAGLNQMFALIPRDLSKWWSEYMLPKFETQSNTALGADTRKNAYNVFSFGVHPDHQNKGIGKALLNVILERASVEQKLVTLETGGDKNIAMYKKWGFLPRGEIEIYVGATGEFDNVVMAREP